MENLVLGQLDWHETLNKNFEEVNQSTSEAYTAATAAAESAAEAAATALEAKQGVDAKLDKPVVTDELSSGYVYQETSGEITLKEGDGSDDGGDTKPPGTFKYTIIVDNGADQNPAAAEYYDDCAGFTPALVSGSSSNRVSSLGDWGDTELYKEYFKPCVIAPEDTVPKYYLQKDNRTLKEDGTPAVLTGADGDVMIEVKKLYGKFMARGDRLKISLSNYKEDDTWFCFNDIGGVEKDVVYRGAYKAGYNSTMSMGVYSYSGLPLLVNYRVSDVFTYATFRGTGYHMNNFYMLLLWQVMFLLMYKGRDSQSVLGRGLTGGTETVATGWSNEKPFCWGSSSSTVGVVFLGCEDFYGNASEVVGGFVMYDGEYKLTRDPSKYNHFGYI